MPPPARILPLLIAIAALAAPALTARAQPAIPTLDNPNGAAVANPGLVRRVFKLAAMRRIDFAIIGDSNVRNAVVSGHEDGYGRAFAAKFGMYAGRVDAFCPTGHWASPILSQSSSQGPPFITAEVSPQASPFIFADPLMPVGGGMIVTNKTVPGDYNWGLTYEADHPVNIAAALRFHLTDYSFGPAAVGYINPTCREAYPGNGAHNYFSLPYDLYLADFYTGVRDMRFDIPAGERAPTGIICCIADLSRFHGAKGPFAGLWQRLENTERPRGISYSPLWAAGGRSARDACVSFNALGPASTQLQEYLRQLTRLQNDAPVLVVQILHGGNDAGDDLPSVGPVGGFDSRTSEGHEDNLRGIIQTIRANWAALGYDAANLFFILGPYHPRSDRFNQQLGYEAAWRRIVETDPQSACVAGTQISTPQEFRDKGWNNSLIDEAHLNITGYRAWARGVVSVLSRAACPSDFNESGDSTVQDIFDFLNAWFTGAIRADFNQSGAVTVQDIFDFLGSWFAGCPQ